jgi:hypothetical protein
VATVYAQHKKREMRKYNFLGSYKEIFFGIFRESENNFKKIFFKIFKSTLILDDVKIEAKKSHLKKLSSNNVI